MTLQLLHSEFPYISGKFDFLFYQCILINFTYAVSFLTNDYELKYISEIQKRGK